MFMYCILINVASQCGNRYSNKEFYRSPYFYHLPEGCRIGFRQFWMDGQFRQFTWNLAQNLLKKLTLKIIHLTFFYHKQGCLRKI
jgi:hypothetical protein